MVYSGLLRGPEIQHRLTAHSTLTSPLSEDASHRWKWQVLKIWLCSWYFFLGVGAPAVSCCYGLYSLWKWQQCWEVGRKKEENTSHWIIADSVQMDHLAHRPMQNRWFFPHFSLVWLQSQLQSTSVDADKSAWWRAVVARQQRLWCKLMTWMQAEVPQIT